MATYVFVRSGDYGDWYVHVHHDPETAAADYTDHAGTPMTSIVNFPGGLTPANEDALSTLVSEIRQGGL